MRESRIAFGVLVTIALVSAITLAAGDRRRLVQSTGAIITRPIASLAPGQRACQRPLVALDEISAVRFNPAAPGPTAILVEVSDARDGRVIARSRIPQGFDQQVTAMLDRRVPRGRSFALCFRNRGPSGLDIYGDDGVTSQCVLAPSSIPCRYRLPHPISSTSALYIDGRRSPGTIAATFLRTEPVSVLASAGEAFQRASTFRPAFVSPALWWIVLVALLVGAPAAILWGLGGGGEPVDRGID